MLDGQRPQRIPHYALKTKSYMQMEYANHEQDTIRQSFSTGNHTWMKQALPVDLAPDAINALRRQRMERNRLAEPVPQTSSKMTPVWGGSQHQASAFPPDEYNRKLVMEREARRAAAEKREKVANHEWRYASQERRMKHEAMIGDTQHKETYPYLGGSKEEELELSKQWLRDNALLGPHGTVGIDPARVKAQAPNEANFLAGKGNGLEDGSKSSRMTLPTIVQRLQKRMELDWEGTTVVVTATDQDLVQVAFHMATVDSERGVLAYMGVLSKDVDLLGNLGLRKVSQLWGLKRDFAGDLQASIEEEDEEGESLEHTWMFFLLMPKWVRMRPTDAYYTVHPRSQGSTFRMSTAGSSVLLSLGSSVMSPAERRQGNALRPSGPPHSARGPGESLVRVGGGVSSSLAPLDLTIIEKAVVSLPSIKEGRGVMELD